MIRLTLLLFTLLLAACVTTEPELEPIPEHQRVTEPMRADPTRTNRERPPEPGEIRKNISLEKSERYPLQSGTTTLAGVSCTYLTFDTRDYSLKVIDSPSGLGQRYGTAAAAAKGEGALAAINGGFFTPIEQPLGLLYSEGKREGSPNKSSLGSGYLYVDRKLPRPVLVRREAFQKQLASGVFEPLEALQAGPFLVENGKATAGLKDSNPAVRSLLLWDGGTHFALAQCQAISLEALAGELAAQPLPDFRIASALNLDGGRSSDFHVSGRVPGGPKTLRAWWNKPVRNYLVLKKAEG